MIQNAMSRVTPYFTCTVHTPQIIRNVFLTSRIRNAVGTYHTHFHGKKSGQIIVIATRSLFISQKQNLPSPKLSLISRHSGVRKEQLSNVAVNATPNKLSKLWYIVAAAAATVTGVVFSVHSKPVLAGDKKVNFIADVVEQVSPAVVYIAIKEKTESNQRKKPETYSTGSGFVVSKNGLIMTNAHVVANINKSVVEITMHDGKVFGGQVIAVDPICDLAVIKIDANELTTIELGKSSELRSGEWVIALGSPLSLTKTVTHGIISNHQRQSGEIGLRNKKMTYIQTDAVINFGNSGGPLVNMDGQCVGVNVMKITTGISFAIPTSYVQKFLTKAQTLNKNGQTENGFAKRRYMGVVMVTLTKNLLQDQLKTFNIYKNYSDQNDQIMTNGGVLIYNVIPGTPAQSGGMLAQDIIIEINGQKVLSAADVYDIVEKSEKLSVKVLRNGRQLKQTIELNTNETF